ncbi:MAG: tail fiber protein, partial [Acidobacteria bacterium]|nr:tail fiber protein [Acidobacteriota bacterium]
MADPFVAEIRIFPFNFAPKGWAFCNGQILPISQNTALFSLLGTTYGGDGRSTFALPNLQGSAPMHPGQGPGLSLHDLGETGGSQTVTLLTSEIPVHTHTMSARPTGAVPPQSSPVGLAAARSNSRPYSPSGQAANGLMNATATLPTGGTLPHNNLMPLLTLNFCIALQGVF